MGTYSWIITPNDIDREIKVWQDRKSGKLRNGWDFLAFNYDAEQIINVLKYGKELNKSVLIISRNLFWKAEIIYDNYSNNINANNTNSKNTNTNNSNSNTPNKDESNITTNKDCDNTSQDNMDIKENQLAINFFSMDQKILFPLNCYSSDNFSTLIKKLYIKFPYLKEKDIYFYHNKDMIDTSITVEENKIKNAANILVYYN